MGCTVLSGVFAVAIGPTIAIVMQEKYGQLQ